MQNLNTHLSEEILDSIRAALKEDIGPGDVTTNSIVPPEAAIRGQIIAKQNGIAAGLDVAQAVYHLFDLQISFEARVEGGAPVENATVLAYLSGRPRSLLTAERTALNFLGRMSGIATLTRQYVVAVSGTGAVILDTRKTAPGLIAARLMWSIWKKRNGMLARGTIGFGVCKVSGLSRAPFPPARISALITATF